MNAIDRFATADTDDRDDFKEAYDNMLDEAPVVKIGARTYSPSQVLEAVDETAYRTGFADWLDSLSDDDMGGRYECENCGERFITEDDANDCCTTDEEADK